MPSVEVIAPAKSIRPSCRGVSGSTRNTVTRTATPIGTFTNIAERPVALRALGDADGQHGEYGGRGHRGPDPLYGARGHQPLAGRGEPAEQRADGEDGHAEQEHPASAEEVARPSAEQEQPAEGERVGA